MAAEVKKTEHVSGRVSEEALHNIVKIGEIMRWSFNQTLNYAMENLKLEDIIMHISNQKK